MLIFDVGWEPHTCRKLHSVAIVTTLIKTNMTNSVKIVAAVFPSSHGKFICKQQQKKVMIAFVIAVIEQNIGNINISFEAMLTK